MSQTPPPNDVSPIAPVPPAPSEGRDRAIGLGLIVVSFLVAVLISARAKEESLPLVAAEPTAPSPAGVEGFPASVKPLGLEVLARKLTPRDQLVGISISGAKGDGTVDTAASGAARFVFRSLEGQGPEPEREYGELALRKFCGLQVVHLSSAGLGAAPDVSNADCKRAIEPLPKPNCSIEQLWALGKQQSAEPGTTAKIEYYRAVAGPAWWFESGAVQLAVAADCSTILSATERAIVAGPGAPERSQLRY